MTESIVDNSSTLVRQDCLQAETLRLMIAHTLQLICPQWIAQVHGEGVLISIVFKDEELAERFMLELNTRGMLAIHFSRTSCALRLVIPAQDQAVSQVLQAVTHSALALPGRSSKQYVRYDEAAMLALALGKVATAFGAEYAPFDHYRRRISLPMPPYLFFSRVTQITGQRGVLAPCTITTEYDLPDNAWFCAQGGQIASLVIAESCHGVIILASYLGIDAELQGERVLRWVSLKSMRFLSPLPRAGETLRHELEIISFVRKGDSLLICYHDNCFVGQRLIFRLEKSCIGFFTTEELSNSKSLVVSTLARKAREQAPKKHFVPLLHCAHTRFNEREMQLLLAGGYCSTLGADYLVDKNNPQLVIGAPETWMLDRVVHIEPQGGPWGLGVVIAEKELYPEQWFFHCHFQHDFIMPGSMMHEAGNQLARFYMLYLGLATRTQNAVFQPLFTQGIQMRFGTQLAPTTGVLRIQLEIEDIGLMPNPYLMGDVDIFFQDKLIAQFQHIGWQLL